jgi:hypothetical protein
VRYWVWEATVALVGLFDVYHDVCFLGPGVHDALVHFEWVGQG